MIMDQHITIERFTRTADGAGGFTKTWATQYVMFANIKELSGSEQIRAERIDAAQQYLITIYAVDAPDVTPADRVNWGDEYLQIRAAPRAQRGIYRRLTCEAGRAQ